MDKNELITTYTKLVDFLVDNGELMKAYHYLKNPPSYIEEELVVLEYADRVFSHLTTLKDMQNTGTIDGKFNGAFTVPENTDSLVGFKILKENLVKLNLKTLVDVGCWTGWVGKELSTLGIAVHGIDIHPVVLQLAAFYCVGTKATFEYLPVQQLGVTHPKHFDGAVLFDVLEHTFDPELTLRNINMATRDGGWIFVNLPHPEGEYGARKHPLNQHEHLYSFSQKKVKELFGGFKKFKLDTITNEGGQPNWFIEYQV